MYLTTVVFDKYYMHFAAENQPVYFSQNCGPAFPISRLFDGMAFLSGAVKKKSYPLLPIEDSC